MDRAQPVEVEFGRLFSASAVTLPRQIAKAVSGPLSQMAAVTKQVGHRIVPAGRQAHLAPSGSLITIKRAVSKIIDASDGSASVQALSLSFVGESLAITSFDVEARWGGSGGGSSARTDASRL